MRQAAYGQEETLDSNYLLVFERTQTFIGIAIMTASPIVQKLGYSIAKKTNGRKSAEPRNALGQKFIDGFQCKVECRLWVITSRSVYLFWAAAFERLPASRRYIELMREHREIFEFVDGVGGYESG